jgi:hypothetical protein
MDRTKIPGVFLAGDSTVQTYAAERAPQAVWGQFAASDRSNGAQPRLLRVVRL